MNKHEADTILLACKKHHIALTIRKEGDVCVVTFIGRIDIKSFEAAKLITNGLVVEYRLYKGRERHLKQLIDQSAIMPLKASKRKEKRDGGVSFADRHKNS